MRLGLVTDIHGHATELAEALRILRTKGVDQIVNIGDACDVYSPGYGTEEVAALLEEAEAVGVWGNHDVGLCYEVEEETRQRCPEAVLRYMGGMQPRLRIAGCHFSHREGSADPCDIFQLWDFSETGRDLLTKSRLGLGAIAERLQFIGHYHQWWAATDNGRVDWDGSRPLHFDPQERYFVIVAPVFEGHFALLDTEEGVLHPLRCETAGTAEG